MAQFWICDCKKTTRKAYLMRLASSKNKKHRLTQIVADLTFPAPHAVSRGASRGSTKMLWIP
jgi:hypothetical protein